MLTWLAEIVGGWVGTVGSSVVSFVRTVVGGIAGVLDLIFGNVSDAWDDLAAAVRTFEAMTHGWLSAVWNVFDRILTYYIPTFAMVAWWWVTNPDALAQVLLWHLLRWLETWAWTAAQYLGEFTLALVVRSLRRLLLLAETVVTAVL